MREGMLIYDEKSGRMDVRFGLDDHYGGLHCGTGMEVNLDGVWKPTRIEMAEDWYLVGIRTDDICGLIVRV